MVGEWLLFIFDHVEWTLIQYLAITPPYIRNYTYILYYYIYIWFSNKDESCTPILEFGLADLERKWSVWHELLPSKLVLVVGSWSSAWAREIWRIVMNHVSKKHRNLDGLARNRGFYTSKSSVWPGVAANEGRQRQVVDLRWLPWSRQRRGGISHAKMAIQHDNKKGSKQQTGI